MLNITFEFVGGPNDGKLVHGRLGESGDAERYYLISNRGSPGQHFSVASPFAVETLARERLRNEQRHCFRRHIYVVTDRIEMEDEVWVRVGYVLREVNPVSS